MGWSAAEKARYVELFIQMGKSIIVFQRKCRQENGIHSKVPSKNQIKAWYNKFRNGEGMNRKKKTKNKVREVFQFLHSFLLSFFRFFPLLVGQD
jgi:transposase-like protein